MRRETAFFIEPDGFREIARACLYDGKPVSANVQNVPDQCTGIAPVSRCFHCCQIFQFAKRFAFGSDDADAFEFFTVIEGEKFAPGEITVDHMPVGIRDEKEIGTPVFAGFDLFDVHRIRGFQKSVEKRVFRRNMVSGRFAGGNTGKTDFSVFPLHGTVRNQIHSFLTQSTKYSHFPPFS